MNVIYNLASANNRYCFQIPERTLGSGSKKHPTQGVFQNPVRT